MKILIDASVDISDIFDQISTEHLIKELETRGNVSVKFPKDAKQQSALDTVTELAQEALEYLQQGRPTDAQLTLYRALHPKWKSAELAAAEFLKFAGAV